MPELFRVKVAHDRQAGIQDWFLPVVHSHKVLPKLVATTLLSDTGKRKVKLAVNPLTPRDFWKQWIVGHFGHFQTGYEKP